MVWIHQYAAWQGAQPQKLTVSMLLPGTSSAAEWRDLLQSRRQFWPTLTTRHASLVPVSAEALQRERRQMQAKHLWYNLDIRWVDLKDKLEVLAPTGIFSLRSSVRTPIKRDATLEKIWRMSNGNGKPRKSTSCSTKRMAATLLALTWPWHFKALTLTTLQRIMQLKTQKHYMHVDGRQKKVFTVSRGRLCLMYVMHLSTMTMLLLLAQMSNRDGGTGMKTMLRDINVVPNGTGQGIPYASSWSSTYESFGPLRTFHSFSPPVLPSNDTCRVSFVLVFGLFGLGFLVCFVVFCFLFCKCHGISQILRAY